MKFIIVLLSLSAFSAWAEDKCQPHLQELLSTTPHESVKKTKNLLAQLANPELFDSGDIEKVRRFLHTGAIPSTADNKQMQVLLELLGNRDLFSSRDIEQMRLFLDQATGATTMSDEAFIRTHVRSAANCRRNNQIRKEIIKVMNIGSGVLIVLGLLMMFSAAGC